MKTKEIQFVFRSLTGQVEAREITFSANGMTNNMRAVATSRVLNVTKEEGRRLASKLMDMEPEWAMEALKEI